MAKKKRQTKRTAKSRARKAPKARKRKSTARKAKRKSRVRAARKPAAKHFGRLVLAHKTATVPRSHCHTSGWMNRAKGNGATIGAIQKTQSWANGS